jgi:hypothetical protein
MALASVGPKRRNEYEDTISPSRASSRKSAKTRLIQRLKELMV